LAHESLIGVHGCVGVKGLFRDSTRILLAVCLEFGGHLGHGVLGGAKVVLDLILLGLEQLDLLPLSLTRVVGGKTVALHTLDAALFLLILGLGTLTRGEVCLWLGEHLAPRLALFSGCPGL
jgi:hypothetical protein